MVCLRPPPTPFRYSREKGREQLARGASGGVKCTKKARAGALTKKKEAAAV